jgi:hypothetical protein
MHERLFLPLFQNKDKIWHFNVINNNHTCCKYAWRKFTINILLFIIFFYHNLLDPAASIPLKGIW